ncbi:hypothetical protein QJS66_19615 [Kocuria rhizophila]|nr:hypothetical protein QJS66_19615 [Kocuria rhizophila]
MVTDQATIPTELVILGLGVTPTPPWPPAPESPWARRGRSPWTADVRTGIEGLAGGDCVEKFHCVSRRHVALALSTHANKVGPHRRDQPRRRLRHLPRVLGTAVTKICDIEVGTHRPRRGRSAGCGSRPSPPWSTPPPGRLSPGAKPIRTKLIANAAPDGCSAPRSSGKKARPKAHRRALVALWHETRWKKPLNIDLSYAPPFSPVWDPALIAARKT